MQLFQCEGFHEVVICACIKSFTFIFQLSLRSGHNQRHTFLLTNCFTDAHTIERWQHPVNNDKLIDLRKSLLKSLFSICYKIDLEAFQLEVTLNVFCYLYMVFYDEYLHEQNV